MAASLHLLRVRALFRVDDRRGDLSRAWVDRAVRLYECAGRARNGRRSRTGDWAGRSAHARPAARSGADARFRTGTRLRVPDDAVVDECDGPAAARTARASIYADAARHSSLGRVGALHHLPVRQVRARDLQRSRAAEIPAGGVRVESADARNRSRRTATGSTVGLGLSSTNGGAARL